jgi:hypothetical protein
MRHSPSLDALRPRPDFQGLLQDLDFPAWPFPGDPPLTVDSESPPGG